MSIGSCSAVRSLSLAVAVVLGIVASGCAAGPSAEPLPKHPAPPAPQTTVTPPPPQLPGGGRSVLPQRRLVGFSGAPGASALGRLTGDLDQAAEQMRAQAAPYGGDRPVQPVFELIASTADSVPGPDGVYRSQASDATVEQYLEAARRHGAILLLGIQPGRADMGDEVRHYEKWLKEPDVGLALDPEWAVGPDSVPGETFGHIEANEINEISTYLADVVRAHNLPQKVMVYHQLQAGIVGHEPDIQRFPEVATVKSVDGIGSPPMKIDTWRQLNATKPAHVAAGFKLFYDEDTRSGPLMTAPEVLALQPKPDYVLYE